MAVVVISFYECEHNSDLQNYLDDLPDDVEVISSEINIEAEIGTVTINAPDIKIFWEEFAKTDAFEFLT